MKCPNCERELEKVTVSEVELDVCRTGCGGIWFDRDELFKFDEPSEGAGCDFLALSDGRADRTKRPGPKPCPRCDGEVLVRQFLDHRNQVEIEQCWSCGGIWFDAGELQRLRNQYTTYEERTKAANGYCEQVIDEYEKASKARGTEAVAEFNQAHATRFRSFVNELKSVLGLGDDPLDV